MIKRHISRIVGTSLVVLSLTCVPMNVFAQDGSPITVGGGGGHAASPGPNNCDGGVSGSVSVQSTTADQSTTAVQASDWLLRVIELTLCLI